MFVAIDPALDRRFQKVFLTMPSYDETIEILRGIKKSYEKHHQLEIPDAIIDEVVKLTEEHMRKRSQPDKSIITMDAACAWHNMFKSESRVLSMDAVYMMVAKETGLHPNALSETPLDLDSVYDPTKNVVDTGSHVAAED